MNAVQHGGEALEGVWRGLHDGQYGGRLPRAERRALALRLAATADGVARGPLAQAAGISGEHARRELHAMTAAGLLWRDGDGRETTYRTRAGAAPGVPALESPPEAP